MVDAVTGAGGASHVKDATDQSFMADVVEASKDVPVLVDFWAPWCGPCKTLGPVLERAVNARGGKVKLVKVNTDENPAYASQLGVRSIPMVFAFAEGRPVDAFMGAQPESNINTFLDKVISGDTGPSQEEIDQVLTLAGEAFRQGDLGQAAQMYAAILQQQPENASAAAGLARCFLAAGDSARATEVINSLPEKLRTDPEIKSVLTAIDLTDEEPAAPDELAGQIAEVEAEPGNADKRFALAEALVAAGRNGEAIGHLLTILKGDLGAKDGAVKALLLKVFEAEGPKSKVAAEGRRALSALMFT